MRMEQERRAVKAHSFKEKVHSWGTKIRVKPEQIRVQKMTRKWASCSTAGWVTFSEDLLREAEPFQDYVIVHELLHLKIPNHGKLFKSLLTAHFPGWKKLSPAQQVVCAR
jgi:predicted metal-dependent hydrolase